MSYRATDCDRCYYGMDAPCTCRRECNSELCAAMDGEPAPARRSAEKLGIDQVPDDGHDGSGPWTRQPEGQS